MSDNTTVTSNDESRKEVNTKYVSDEDVRNNIKKWTGEEKEIIIAAIDWEAVLANELEQEGVTGSSDESSEDTSSSYAGGRKRRIRVGSKVSKGLNSLIIDPLVTVGAKKQNEKTKMARKAKEKMERQQKEQREQEKE